MKQIAVKQAILLFQENPYDPILKNHKLSGKLHGVRAISAGFDLRVLFIEQGGYASVTFIDVGSHEDVYC